MRIEAMTPTTLLVMEDPKAAYLAPLRRLPTSLNVDVVISNQLDVLAAEAPQADAILLAGDPNLLRAVFPAATRLRWLQTLSAGVESVLFPELVSSPVVMTNARGVFKSSLAEFVIASALYFAKDFRRMVRNQEEGTWDRFDVDELRGKVMGIVGYGATGQACAELARPFGMSILGLRRRPELCQGDPLLDKVLGPNGLMELLKESDYVVIAAPATAETRHLIGEAELKAMKPSSVLINVGRGWSIDEAALVRALESGSIRGAALDVFALEPLPPGHRFYSLKNLLLSPHIADHVADWESLSLTFFLQNLERFVQGQVLENIVDKGAGY
jgi:phosphoglycerate dehydrogenase-like enzyme